MRFSFQILIIIFLTTGMTSIMSAQEIPEEVKKAAEAAVKMEREKAPQLKKKSIWKTLAKITYKKEYDELMGFKIDVPVFSAQIKKLEGTEVIVKGYIIPVEGYKSHKEFILSAFPYNMCFFCGGAGPETVMEVEAVEGIEYSAEQVYIKGKLSLNDTDINHLMYLLTDAQLVK